MADLVSTLEKIIRVGLEINTAVETVRQNREDCSDIQERVVIVRAILTHLRESTKKMIEERMEITENPAMDSALADLEKTLRRALKHVKDCQEKNILCLFCTAGDLSKQLRRVQEDISHKMMSVQFATTVHITFLIIGLNKQGARPPQLKQKDAGEVKITHGDDLTGNDRGGSQQGETMVETGCEDPSPTLPGLRRQFSLSELEAATDNFSDERYIGRGAFAKAYKGVLHDGLVVVVKRFVTLMELDTEKILLNELKIVAKLEHKNIVKHLGYCMDTTSEIVQRNSQCIAAEKQNNLLVLHYLPNGSLREIIVGRRHVDWSSCFRIIQGIAQGVNYLHQQRIIHSDLKPENVLFDLDMNPVIIDFGTSVVLDPDDEEVTVDTIVGSLGYLAPEYILLQYQSIKSDVFAFGVTLIETVTSVATGSPMGRGFQREEWDMMLKKAGGLKGLLNETVLVNESQLMELNRCVDVGLLCSEYEPEDRPTMADVLQMLNGEKPLPTRKNNRTKRWPY